MGLPRLLSLLYIGASILGGLFLAYVLGYGRLWMLMARRANLVSARPLSEAELQGLRRWQRWNVRLYLIMMVWVVLYSGAYAIPYVFRTTIRPEFFVAGFLFWIAVVVAGLAHHFWGRCPVCRRRVAFQSSLLLPARCETCGTIFRPESPLAQVSARSGMRASTQRKLFGWPLASVAWGPNPMTGERSGVAKGIVAVGDVAVGVVAVGRVAVGLVSVGGTVAGMLGLGGISMGLLAVGGVAIGGFAAGGVALGGWAIGGLAVGFKALGGLAVGAHARGGAAFSFPRR
jgi:hypothetical protein